MTNEEIKAKARGTKWETATYCWEVVGEFNCCKCCHEESDERYYPLDMDTVEGQAYLGCCSFMRWLRN